MRMNVTFFSSRRMLTEAPRLSVSSSRPIRKGVEVSVEWEEAEDTVVEQATGRYPLIQLLSYFIFALFVVLQFTLKFSFPSFCVPCLSRVVTLETELLFGQFWPLSKQATLMGQLGHCQKLS